VGRASLRAALRVAKLRAKVLCQEPGHVRHVDATSTPCSVGLLTAAPIAALLVGNSIRFSRQSTNAALRIASRVDDLSRVLSLLNRAISRAVVGIGRAIITRSSAGIRGTGKPWPRAWRAIAGDHGP